MEKLRSISKKRKVIIGISILLIIVLIITIKIAGKNKKKEKFELVEVYTVERNPVSSLVSSTGIVEENDKEVIYSKISTTVKTIKEVGDIVNKGDIIVSFDDDLARKLKRDLEKLELQLSVANKALSDLNSKATKDEILQVESNLAQVEKSEKDINDSIKNQEITINQIKRELESANELKEKKKILYESDMISQKEYDDILDSTENLIDKLKMAEIQLSGLKESIKVIKVQKESANHKLKILNNEIIEKDKKQLIANKESEIKTINLQIEDIKDEIDKAQVELTSPINGVISEVLVEKGANIVPGTQLMKILDVSMLKVIADISIFNIPQVKIGQEVIIKQDSMEGNEYLGVVSEIAPSAIKKQSGTSTNNVVPVTIEIKDDNVELKPGYNVEVKIKTVDKDDAITVPILSIMEDVDEDYKYVFVIKEDNTLEERVIKEITLDNIYVEIEGVDEGEKIVANPNEDMYDGMKVSISELGDIK